MGRAQLSRKRAVLKRGEEGVEFGEGGLLGGFGAVDCFNAGGEVELEIKRWERHMER